MCKHIDQVKHLQLRLISEQEMEKEAAKLTRSLDDCKQLLKVKEAHCKYLEKLLDEAFREVCIVELQLCRGKCLKHNFCLAIVVS